MSSKHHEVILHFVFTPKYRKPMFKGEVTHRLAEIIYMVCEVFNVEVIALAIREDHVHLLVSLPRSVTRAKFVQHIKGVSSRLLRKEFPHLVEISKTALWGRDYFVRSVGGGRKAVAKYIEDQKL